MTTPFTQDFSASERGPLEREDLPPKATAYLLIVLAAAAAVTAQFILQGDVQQVSGDVWTTFTLLALSSAVAQVFVVITPKHQAYHATIAFLVAAILLLPPELLPFVAVVQHLAEWLKKRYAWYIQAFNIANYTLDLLAAQGASRLVLHADGLISDDGVRFALAGVVAGVVLVAVNHALLALMLLLGRGLTFRELDLFSIESMSTELVLAALGVVIAAFWESNVWLIPFAVAPLLLIHRSLSVPQLQEEARVDAKTGLFNARYFATAITEELSRAERFDRPLSLIMADLDLLRDINNTYGHLAGDAVLKGISETFRGELRHYDVPARFGGEEFAILLPETPPEQALVIAERIRRAVASCEFEVETSGEPIHATISIGVAGFPRDAADANELIHQADLAVYRAKLQGRNRVVDASDEPLVMQPGRSKPLVAVPEDGDHVRPLAPAIGTQPARDRRHPRPQSVHGPTFFSLSRRLAAVVGAVGVVGTAAGILGLVFGTSNDVGGMIAIIALVGVGQALALELDLGSISVSAVGALAGAALFGPRAALAVAATTAAVEWSARRQSLHHVLFNVGALTLASLTAAAAFSLHADGDTGRIVTIAAGIVAGLGYFAVNMGLVSLATAVEGHERWSRAFLERFAWLIPHYLVYGFIGSVIYLGYRASGLWALAVFAVPLFLMRKTQETYLRHTQKTAQKLREAAETIQTQNVSLEQANRMLRERSTAAMESLSATVDARDAYTAGHSRRVHQLALAIGRELSLSSAELDLLGYAALFHDIGKIAVPDAVLLKPASLTDEEWALMQQHAGEGARIIDRLGFLDDAVPAIRHHHERFDGRGYPDGLSGEEIPLGARIIHVADALDSMLTTRIYRPARPATEALEELRTAAGTQFCPRCVSALERILPVEQPEKAVREIAQAVGL